MSKIEQLKLQLAKSLMSDAGLQRVEELIHSKFSSESLLLSRIPQYQFDLGGKRIRPLLALTCAKALGMREPLAELIDIAAGIELIHLATLLHDDIIDKSPLRRNQESAFLKFGVPDTLLAGDFLLVRAFSLCANLDSYIIAATERACVNLTEGEIEEKPLSQRNFTLEQVLEVARKKTAALFRLAAESAAHLCEESEEVVQAMARFGSDLGIAFQAIDDILDVQGNEDVFGKRPGQDLRERKPSLVNVLWLESGSMLAKELLTPAPQSEEKFIEAALSEIKAGAALARAREIAAKFALGAQESLKFAASRAANPDANSLAKLSGIADYCLARVS